MIKKQLKIERIIFIACLIICIAVIIYTGIDVKALEKDVEKLEYQNSRQAAQLKDREEEIEILEIILKNQKEDASEVVDEPEYIGTFTLTAYCPCEICCGEWALNRPDGIVYGAAGVELQEGVSVACSLPFGTTLQINEQKYIVQDRTAEWIKEKYEEKIIDMYFENHETAEKFGKQTTDVWIVEEKYNGT